MSAETIISIIAVLVASLSALYARWAVKEAKKANELNRFKALLDLKSGYLAEMDNQMRAAKDWGKDDGFVKACRDKFTQADTKHREVCKELDVYHSRLVKNEI
ncbi:hypothetical protein AVO42_06600 [Thiomicrospira sp. XS5]|uniref:hypothetical protein n=1 Tax=Thiomicrospira sp. XS5 TaxID=1775636 RepID=UPI000747F2A6|nr:hypothetical protein [Thiomicrospira sp. XS5]KUJ75024.1 hypothetical protein AVO42_06600 [Thiomicrospira sp. XS5]